MYAFTLSLVIHLVLIFPLAAKDKKISAHAFKINQFEFVPSKVETIEVPVAAKVFHSKKKNKKKVVRTQKKIINNNAAMKGNPFAESYYKSIRKKIISNHSISKKARKLKLKGIIKAKIQIQQDGSYDILNVSGKHPELIKMTKTTLAKIKNFNPIPKELEQQEIQLIIPMSYNLK